MGSLFENYIHSISSKFSRPETSEMGYRADFETLIKGVFEEISVRRIDHDARATQGNKPDFVVYNHGVPILYIEAKDIGVSLDKVEKSEQMARYYGYTNLVLTDYLEFRFYRNGLRYEEPIKIANFDIKNRTISPLSENYEHVSKTLIDFSQSQREPIKSGKHLAKIMGGRAQRIRDNVRHFLSTPAEKVTDIFNVYETVKKLLVHDLTHESFADMYAQTLVYGLFVARYYDESPDNFSRQEARELIPASNPFLGHFFDHIAGRNFEKRLGYIVDELCEIFKHADVQELMKEYFKQDLWGEAHKGPDPVVHFYEDFLKEYDEHLRKRMGAYYTPLPIVQFIVRSVDAILERDFGLVNGLSDITEISPSIHRVQVLDPAVGTGTFLSAVIDAIYSRQVKLGQKGAWPSYVHSHLLPRLFGFELMMASYTIAHLKVSMKLKETGFKYFNETRKGKTRLGLYLTNSLEDTGPQQELLAFDLGAAIAEEAREASKIKNDKPIMVVLGNPPYSAVSSNKGANFLVEKYMVEPGGTVKLDERKNWLNDDYVKFISFAENLINKNGEGILAYITNNGFIDNPTFRGMRWHLLRTFSDIYIVDLHGNAKKKERTPSGEKDENVFNIMQGVSINIFVKKSAVGTGFGNIYHVDLYGKRESKFDFLNKNSLESISWDRIKPTLPNLFFVKKGELKNQAEYDKGFSLGDKKGGLFVKHSCGVVTMGDNFIVDVDRETLLDRLDNFLHNDEGEAVLKSRYKLGKNYAKWIISNKAKIHADHEKVIPYSYRPFDDRLTVFDKNLIWRTRETVMKDVAGNEFSMVFEKIASDKSQPVGIYISKNIIDCHFTGGQSYIGNLYTVNDQNKRTSNLNSYIAKKIELISGKTTPEDVFDYVYASLHSPSYREKYKEFLKIDFPRVPYPESREKFWKLVEFGRELRGLHLLESPKVGEPGVTFDIPGPSGESSVEKVVYKDSKVWINDTQYFGNVPEVAWNFYIGGYQPAQKWLKDRKGRSLTSDDVTHYQKMIMALTETERIMKEIDSLEGK